MRRCASSFIIATYVRVGLIPQASRALPLALFTKSSEKNCLVFFLMHQPFTSV
jgi:hypothetical protein